MTNGVNSSIRSPKSILWRFAIQGPADHFRSFFCFWRPTIARRITGYFLIFGLIIFLFSTFIYVVAARNTFLKSAGSLVQGQFSHLQDETKADSLLSRVDKSQPEMYRMFNLLSSLSSVYYAVADVAFYKRASLDTSWTRMYFQDSDVLKEIPASNPSLDKLEKIMNRRFQRMQTHLLKTGSAVTMFVNVTGSQDKNRYYLGIELDSETFTGFIRRQMKLFVIFLIVGMLISRLLAHIFVRRIARPIETLSETVSKVAQGDLTHEVSVTSKDEIGQLATDVNTMIVELREWDRIKRIEFELEKGQEIQREFLPRSIPQVPNWEIAAFFKPAGKVAGDFYDIFSLKDGYMGLVIGDVCDKGVGSALYMALFRSLIRVFSTRMGFTPREDDTPSSLTTPDSEAMRSDGDDPVASLRAVSLTNDYIAQIHGDEGMFATIFFGVLDSKTGRLYYVNGGHEPLLIAGSTGIKTSLQPTGPAVGVMAGMEFGVQDVYLKPGDILLGYTDGLTEARSAGDELFSRDRLNNLFDTPVETASLLLETIQSNLFSFMDGAPRNDDVTMLAVQRR